MEHVVTVDLAGEFLWVLVVGLLLLIGLSALNANTPDDAPTAGR
jgi:hypothetical protein